MNKLNPDIIKTGIEMFSVYAFILLQSYMTFFHWDRIEGFLPDIMRYPCGGRIASPSNPNVTSLFGDDPFSLNINQGHTLSVTPSQAFYGATFSLLAYWTSSVIFFCLDVYYDQFSPRGTWKMMKHPEPNRANAPDYKLYRFGVRLAFINNFTSIFGLYVVTYTLGRKYNFSTMCGFESYDDPAYLTIIRLLATYFLTDIIFYTTHRLCHENAFLYRYIHKTHHLFINSYAVAAAACNPIEHLGVNLSTVQFAPLITGLPINYWISTWTALAALNTCCTHSGFRFIPSFEHDEHHALQICEFGTATFMDRIFRTTTKDKIKGGGVAEATKRMMKE